MTTHEIPFTRTDFLLILAGQPKALTHKLFIAAVEGQLLSVNTETGRELEQGGLFNAMTHEGNCHFKVPSYLWSALAEAQDRQGDDSPTWHGVKLKPWSREFIVAVIKDLPSHAPVDEHDNQLLKALTQASSLG